MKKITSDIVERLRLLGGVCKVIEELTDISGKVKSSRPDYNTDVLILTLGKLRILVDAIKTTEEAVDEIEWLRDALDVPKDYLIISQRVHDARLDEIAQLRERCGTLEYYLRNLHQWVEDDLHRRRAEGGEIAYLAREAGRVLNKEE